MKKIVDQSLYFLSGREKKSFFVLLIGRCLATILDLLGVLALGYLGTSVALFLSKGSDASRSFSILGHSISAANIQTLPWILLGTLILFIAKALVSIGLTRKMAINFAVTESRAARKIAENVLGGNLTDSRKISQEELLFAITTGTSSAFSGLFNNLSTLVSEGFLFLGIVFTFLAIDPIATLGVLAYFSIVAIVIHHFTGTRIARQSRFLVQNALDANRALIDLSTSFRELAVLNKRSKYFDRIEQAKRASAEAIGTQLYLAGMPRYVIETAVLLGALAFAGIKLISGDLASSVTTLAIFLTGSMRIVAAMLPWQAALVSIKGIVPQVEFANRLLVSDLLPPQPSVDVAETPKDFSAPAAVNFDKVSFSFEKSEYETIRGLDFSISPGSFVSFIGPSGAGKSTIADLMLGLLSPSSGRISISGQAPSKVMHLAPGYMAYVPQTPGALSGTIRENITLMDAGQPINDDDLEYAIENSHLFEVLRELPKGIDTDLGIHRDSLSGGQLQRVGLARALYSRPRLLVLDEATSALDADSENEITRALRTLKGKVTVVVIAHRLNTVQDSDVVFLVSDGHIVDSGDFASLARRNSTVAHSISLMSVKD